MKKVYITATIAIISMITIIFVNIPFGLLFLALGLGLVALYRKKNEQASFFTLDSTVVKIPKYITPAKHNTEELVVAHCNENLDWIDDYSSSYQLVTIYTKCGKPINLKSPNIKIITTPNIGSCDYCYLSYVIDRYENLPDFVEFTKGWKPPLRKYNNCMPCKDQKQQYEDLMNFYLNNHEFQNTVNRVNNTEVWHNSGYKNMREWIRANNFLSEKDYQKNVCNIIYGGQFGTTSEQIRKTPKNVWENLRSQQKYAREEVDHYIERTWRILLCRPKYKLVIIAMFKNESHIMREWLTHYINQGVEHFYMIDNGSTDEWRIETKDMPVTVYTDTRKHCQTKLYSDYFLEEVKRDAEWVAVLDLDEFMYARNGYKKISDYLFTVDDNIGNIEVKWKMFGSNNHIKQPKWAINSFTKRKKFGTKDAGIASIPLDFFGKCIGRTINIVDFSDHHKGNVKDCKKLIYPEQYTEESLSESPLHINHYAIQSQEFFRSVKMARGDSYYSTNLRDNKWFLAYDFNDIEDTELKLISGNNYECNYF